MPRVIRLSGELGMDRRTLIATGLTAAGMTAVGRAAWAQEAVSSSEPPPPGDAQMGAEAAPPPEPPVEAAPADVDFAAEPPIPDPTMPPPPPEEMAAAEPEPMPTETPDRPSPRMSAQPSYRATTKEQAFSRHEVVNGVSNFMGVPAEAAGSAVERVFRENGEPTAYIAGEEGSGAFFAGVRYGKGLLYMKGKRPLQVYWQGPTLGWDFGGNVSRVFTLAYNLHVPEVIFRRYPGVEGSAYFIGGLGVNYQRAEDVVLAPIRAGVGLRLGANVGYLAYSKKRHLLPF